MKPLRLWAVKKTAATSVTPNEITPFEWGTLYSFAPYVPKEKIERVIGFSDYNIRKTVSEGMVHLLFVKDGKLVCNRPLRKLAIEQFVVIKTRKQGNA